MIIFPRFFKKKKANKKIRGFGSFRTAAETRHLPSQVRRPACHFGRVRTAAESPQVSQVLTPLLWLFPATQCPPLRAPERGSMTCPHAAGAAARQPGCRFSCDEGSALVGPEVVRCMASGEWTASPPVCRGECGRPGRCALPCARLLRGVRAGEAGLKGQAFTVLPSARRDGCVGQEKRVRLRKNKRLILLQT